MALTDFVGRILGPSINAYLSTLGLGGKTESGQTVDADTPYQLVAVRSAIQTLAFDLASLPLKVYQRDGVKREARDHALYDVIHSAPNGRMTSFEWRVAMWSWLLTWGNAYNWIQRDQFGNVVGIWPLRADRVSVYIDPDSRKLAYEYRPADDSMESQVFSFEEILHVKGLTTDGLVGRSPIADLRERLGESKAVDRFSQQFFGNSARPEGVLTHPATLGQDAQDRLKRQMEERRNGKFSTLILEEGMTWQQLTFPPEDAQLMETREFSVLDWCRVFNLPPYKLRVNSPGSVSYNSVEIQQLDYNISTLRPWAVNFEQAVNRACLTYDERKAGYYVELNLDATVRADIKTRFEAHQIALRNGIVSIDEVRSIEGWNPYGDGSGAVPRVTADTVALTSANSVDDSPDESDDASA